MLFNSIDFLCFFPVVVLFYFVIPQKARPVWLLAASYYFYMSWNPKYALLIAATTIVTWGAGILIGRDTGTEKDIQAKKVVSRGALLVICLLFNLGILAFFKYFNFLSGNLQAVFHGLGLQMRLPVVDLILPVGISFYTFQALGYVIDVYRGETRAERNLLNYALFISFFPQLVAGPIERSKNLLQQIRQPHTFDPSRAVDGLLLMGWGFFEKMVLADRIAMIVDKVYDHFTGYSGLQIALATVLFAFQIYCDFAGYSDIAIGAARVMGFCLMKNFKSPYYATTVSGFWRRWHISLTTWFRDYVYIPLGGNRCTRWKWCRNLLLTFALSGLWHGASWHFVAWGLLNGLYQVIGKLSEPARTFARKKLRIRQESTAWRILQGVMTFVMVDFAWMFFRADGFLTALRMIRHGLSNTGWQAVLNFHDLLSACSFGIRKKECFVILLGLLVLMLVDYLRPRVDLKAVLKKQNIVVRYSVYYAIIFVILIFGIYGPEYDAASFIYFQF